MQCLVLRNSQQTLGFCVTNYHEINNLKQQAFILLLFGRPGVLNRGLGRAVLPLERLGETFPASPSL